MGRQRTPDSGCPTGAELVRTYKQLYYLLDGWEKGDLNFIILIGPPGPGKSTAVRQHLGDNARVILGGATPYRFYKECWANTDRLLVLDDADKIFKNPDGANLIKHLTQTDPVKRLEWNSNTAEINKGELPASFVTTSRVVIISNSWKVGDADIDAISSRGHLLYFNPSPAEMARYAASWVNDIDVWEFVTQHLGEMERPDLRLYGKAMERKALGERRAKESKDLDDAPHITQGYLEEWQRFVLNHRMKGAKMVAWKLMQDSTYPNDYARSQVFAMETGKTERTFYRYAAELQPRKDEGGTQEPCQIVKDPLVKKLFTWGG